MNERHEDRERLIGYVKGFRDRRIAVLGDLVADEFVYGDIVRVSREAPVLILAHRRTESAPGGGGNSVANLRALGAQPLPIGFVGRDEAGKRLLAELRRMGCKTSGILVRDDYETPAKSRVLAGGVHTRRQQIVRVDRGSERHEPPAKVRAALKRALRTALGDCEGLLVADYGYGAAGPRMLEGMKARMRGLPVTVDSRSRLDQYRNLTACTPNHEELEQVIGSGSLVDDNDVTRGGRELRRRTRCEAVLVTRGACGMSLFEKRRPASHIPPYGTDDVADVTGAGDTVIAAFTLGLISGARPVDAARIANYAAGLVVRKAGTATTNPTELIDAIREDLE